MTPLGTLGIFRSNMKLIMRAACFVAAWGLSANAFCGIYSGPIDDDAFDSLSEQVERAYQELLSKMEEAEAAGVSTEYAETTRITVQLFKDLYIPWDRANPSSHHSSWKEQHDPLYRNFGNTPGIAVPFDELADCLEIIEAAIGELQQQIDGEITLQDVPDFSVGTYTLNDAYYELDGQKVIPFKIFWQPSEDGYYEAYGNMGGTYYGVVPHMDSPNSKNDWNLTRTLNDVVEAADKNANPIEFWHGTVASQNTWPRSEFPDMFNVGGRFFNHYDIDHPNTRPWEEYLIENILAPIAEPAVNAGVLRSHLLNNEPRFPIRQGNGDAANGVSEYTFKKFADWLREKYRSIEELNTVYGASHTDFSEASTANFVNGDGVSESLQGGPVWYDWLKFNQWRVNDWFVFLNDSIHAVDPTGHTHIKIWGGGAIHVDYQDQGIDYEFLTKLVDIAGSDSQFIPLNIEYDIINSWPTDWKGRYMFDWRQQGVMMDFIKSIAPDKPYKDSEWHGVDSARWLSFHNTEEYLRPALWLAASHGLSAINTWFLNRNEDGSVRRLSQGVNGTFAVQPIMMNAYGRIMKEINAHADTFASFTPKVRNYVIFYSNDSAIQDRTYSDQMTDVYEALKLLNVPVGFTTPSDLVNMRDSSQTLIVPRTEFISDDDLAALEAFVDAGGSVVLVDAQRCFTKTELGADRGGVEVFNSYASVNYDADPYVLASAFESALVGRKPELPVCIEITTTSGDPAYGVLAQQFRDEAGEGFVILINASQLPRNVALRTPTRNATGFEDVITGRPHLKEFSMAPQQSLLLKTGPYFSGDENWDRFVNDYRIGGRKESDFDNDGLSDWGEYVFDGDPVDPFDVGIGPHIDPARSVLGFRIRNDDRVEAEVVSNADLGSEGWDVEGVVQVSAGDGSMKQFEVPVELRSERRFFRVVAKSKVPETALPPYVFILGESGSVGVASSGNGNFEAEASLSGILNLGQMSHWHNLSGGEEQSCGTDQNMGGSPEPDSRGAYLFHTFTIANDTGYTVSAAGEVFEVSLAVLPVGASDRYDGDERVVATLFAAANGVGPNTSLSEITLLGSAQFPLTEWETHVDSDFYTSTEFDVGKTVYLGIRLENPSGENVFPRIDVVRLEVNKAEAL